MNQEVKAIDVTVMGREFRVACPEGDEDALLTSVNYLDRKMHEIRDAGKVIGVERIAIMAALNIAHELLSTRVTGSFDVGEFKRRMKSMEAQLDLAMADQDELF
ncbi:MAG TPA: cell division protein ZapA [Betaproteobacteria bacterium]|nr:cell division protein ZapA [Betaproteobacteria bacterium]